MNGDIRILIGGVLIIIVVFILAFPLGLWSMNCGVNATKALECPHNDITAFGFHNVTFVVVNAESCPLTNMRIKIACVNFSTHNYTTINGSCSFLLEGSRKHTIIIDNVHTQREKSFVLYPINSCYLIVI